MARPTLITRRREQLHSVEATCFLTNNICYAILQTFYAIFYLIQKKMD